MVFNAVWEKGCPSSQNKPTCSGMSRAIAAIAPCSSAYAEQKQAQPRQSMPLGLYGRGEPVQFKEASAKGVWFLLLGAWRATKVASPVVGY